MDNAETTALSTLGLLIVTAIYAFLVHLTLKDAQKSREIEFIEKKIERFYSPIQNALSSIDQNEDNIGESYIIEKADALNKTIKEVQNYNYLASPELRKLVQNFPKFVRYFNNPSILTMDPGDAYSEIATSIDRIEILIAEDIKKYRKKLNELTFNESYIQKIKNLLKLNIITEQKK